MRFCTAVPAENKDAKHPCALPSPASPSPTQPVHLVAPASCSVPIWGQCGDVKDQPSKGCCMEGLSCKRQNPWYAQCLTSDTDGRQLSRLAAAEELGQLVTAQPEAPPSPSASPERELCFYAEAIPPPPPPPPTRAQDFADAYLFFFGRYRYVCTNIQTRAISLVESRSARVAYPSSRWH